MGNELLHEINKKIIYEQERTAFHTPSDTALKLYFCTQVAGHFICDKEFRLRRKGYRSILVNITLDGCGLLKYRGKQYELKKNQVMIIDCYDYHERSTYKFDYWDNKWIHFNGDISFEYFNHIFENHGPLINMPEDNLTGDYIDQIILMLEKGDPRFEIKASLIIHQILSSILLASSSDANTLKNPEYQYYIKTAREFIENNYQKHISVNDIAEAAGLSRFHCSKVFRRFTGFYPHEFLVKYKINKAKTLLKNTNLSMEDIANLTGFFDASSFIRTFKKNEVITPLKYGHNFTNK